MPKAVQVNYEKIFSEVSKTKTPEKKTSISVQKAGIYSRFLHIVKTSVLRSAPSLDDVAPNVRPQVEVRLHFRVPSLS